MAGRSGRAGRPSGSMDAELATPEMFEAVRIIAYFRALVRSGERVLRVDCGGGGRPEGGA